MQKTSRLFYYFLLFSAFLSTSAFAQSPVNYVDPFIGTAKSDVFTRWGSEGGTYPGAVAPSGYIQLSPETRGGGTYNYDDSSIFYFSCTRHMSGFPSGSAGRLFIMPVSGDATIDAGYNRQFSHRNEKAEPGYYSVLLDDGILAEATATERSGMFRFTFPAGMIPKIMIRDAGQVVSKSSRLIHSANSVFLFSSDAKDLETRKDATVISFKPTPGKKSEIVLRLSVSGAGVESAKRNLEVEIGQDGFNQVKAKTKTKWSKELSVVEVTDSSTSNKTIFYTALYHSLLLPWIISDVDGNYRGADGKIHKTNGKAQYGGFSPWDTFRSLHPLLTLLYPEKQRDMLLSMLDIYQQSGFLPIESMTGNHSVPIIADSYLKGISGIDRLLAYRAMKKSIMEPPFLQHDMEAFLQQGYIPFSYPESVTRTVEYAYDNWALASYAKSIMKNDKDHEILMKRSSHYRNLFNVQDLSMLPRKDEEFKMNPGTIGYKEGDKWVYSYFVPHNGKDLVNLKGGNKAFADQLDAAFADSLLVFDNETVFHVPYLFNDADDPARTQKWVRKFMQERFGTGPGGLPGNDDLGSMSSWYVFSALGFYPVSPGRPDYAIGSPLLKSVTLQLRNGKKFRISSHHNNDTNYYIQSIRLNNKKYISNTLSHSAIVKGGGLEFEMGPGPKNIFPPSHGDARIQVTSASVSKKEVEPNEPFRIYFNLRNQGDLGTKIVRLYVNGQVYDSINCLVPASGSVTDSIVCRLYPFGPSVVKIDESNSMELEVTKPVAGSPETLQIKGLFVSPMLQLNEMQRMHFVAKNIGGETRGFNIPLMLKDSVIKTLDVTLRPGQEIKLTAEFAAHKEGFQDVSVHGTKQQFKVYSKANDAVVLSLEMKNIEEGKIIKDQSGWKNNGMIITTKNQPVKPGSDLLLGEDCYIEVPNATSLDVMNESLTMMAWVHPEKETRGLVDLLTKGDNHVLQLSGNKLGFFAGGWGRGDCMVDLPANWVGNWHHIAGVCDGNSLQVYIDGKLMGKTTLADPVNLSVTSKWNVGRNEEFPNERIFHGYMNRIKVFTAPLTETEILQEMGKAQQ
ncbi:GH92 family glycosyl hydrolase [Flavihumibacter solisilvae]|uniref:LamG-like jellyroll fold domain-containing protein n=1 Tax=Flavihumibacter solisilvae TaxID=1349421 RepID=A0A0C1L4Z1_9BACT|nr:GH92 family glycosyl hydrolase [Flavihumibacter solisilvae]KIC94616.1 hypothetical protein OI18_10990 [Flavihumibacter solisilvae]